MRACGHPDFTIADLPEGRSFNGWLHYWYGATDGSDTRRARALAYTEMEPGELAEVLWSRPWLVTPDPTEYPALQHAFLQLVSRWIEDPTTGEQA